MELDRVPTAKAHEAQTFYRLGAIPGVGQSLALVLLDELHDIRRFPRVQECAAYWRLVQWAKESAGQRSGTAGTKIGNADLKWAVSGAAVLFLRNNPAGQKYLTRLARKHGTGKAVTIPAHPLARAVYDRLKRDPAFDLDKFLRAEWSGAGEPAASLAAEGLSLTSECWQPWDAASWNASPHLGPASLLPGR